jgi:hypothetical protein
MVKTRFESIQKSLKICRDNFIFITSSIGHQRARRLCLALNVFGLETRSSIAKHSESGS